MCSNRAQVCIKSNKKIEQRLWFSFQTIFWMTIVNDLLPHMECIYIYIYIYIAFYWINSCRKHLCNNDNGWLKHYIPFLKKYWKAILKKMRSAIVFLTLLVCTPLKGKYIVISIQVCIYIMLNYIDYSKLCHHCVLGHTNEIKSLFICYLKCHFIWFSAKTSSQYC